MFSKINNPETLKVLRKKKLFINLLFKDFLAQFLKWLYLIPINHLQCDDLEQV